MGSVEEEVVDWLNDRPSWLKSLAKCVIENGDADSAFIHGVLSDQISKKVRSAPAKFKVSDLPTVSNVGTGMDLVKISNLLNVNALTDGGELSFGAAGLTVIYGDNGSGKSGFARLIKHAVGARHQQQILGNAFKSGISQPQSADIIFRAAGKELTFKWPGGSTSGFRQVRFFDEACGDHYLVNDTELTYRPSVLMIFDRLVTATDALREAAERELSLLEEAPFEIPGLLPSTAAGAFAMQLSADTTDAQIDAAATLPIGAEKALANLVQVEGRLQASSPELEQDRLTKTAQGLKAVAGHLESLYQVLSVDSARGLEQEGKDAASFRAAADLASRSNFADEPLEGVGSSAWRTLWKAAEAYSREVAYHEHDFPFLGENARCPLCQQTITNDALTRFKSFDGFVRDETATKATKAEAEFAASIELLRNLEVTSVSITNSLAAIELECPDVVRELRTTLGAAEEAKLRILDRVADGAEEPLVDFLIPDTGRLRSSAEELQGRSVDIDAAAFAEQLKAAKAEKNELKDLTELAKHIDKLKAEAAKQRKVRELTAVRDSYSTGPITKKSMALTRAHVTERVKEHFAKECTLLGLSHVTLDDKGGGKGKLRHKPALLGATLSTKTVREVLSEGEQTALGLAGLLTELNFDESKSALVLDDPITSLDHGRREKVAKRIAALAGERQVIVFTHDLTFLGDLIRAAAEGGVDIQELSIVKNGDGVPGRVLSTHPWKAKDAKKRLGDLREQLAKLRKEQATLSSDEYSNRVQMWAGLLSETWERIVRNDVVGRVVDRGTTEVRPRMLKLIAQITMQDNADFQSGYSQVSKWAPRHDKSEEVNFIAPALDEMEAELSRIDSWHKRVVSYGNA